MWTNAPTSLGDVPNGLPLVRSARHAGSRLAKWCSNTRKGTNAMLNFREIARELASGDYVPFLGAGSSSPSSPSADALATHLANAAQLSLADTRPPGCSCQCNCGHSRFSLDSAASYYEMVSRTRASLDSALDSCFQNHARDAQPLKVHRYLADLPAPRLIISTNYDLLIEEALRGKAFDVLVLRPNDYRRAEFVLLKYSESGEAKYLHDIDPDDLARDIDLEQRTLVYKIHGSIMAHKEGHRSGFLVTEEDYERALLDIDRFLPPAIIEHLDSRKLLFLGYSLKDWNVRALMRRLLGFVLPNSKAIMREPTSLESRLWLARNLEIVDMPLDEFVGGLSQASSAGEML